MLYYFTKLSNLLRLFFMLNRKVILNCNYSFFNVVYSILAAVLLSNANSVIKTRTLSCIADLLSAKAGIIGGLRSGPGSNCIWSDAFTLLLVSIKLFFNRNS